MNRMSEKTETITTIISKENIEISRKEIKENAIFCDICGVKTARYRSMFETCAICGRDTCVDHRIDDPSMNGGVICSDCYKTHSDEIKNLNQAKKATEKALITISETSKVYRSLCDALYWKADRKRNKKK